MRLVGLRLAATALTGALALATFAGTATAQEYPTRPIRLIVPYGAGVLVVCPDCLQRDFRFTEAVKIRLRTVDGAG